MNDDAFTYVYHRVTYTGTSGFWIIPSNIASQYGIPCMANVQDDWSNIGRATCENDRVRFAGMREGGEFAQLTILFTKKSRVTI